jgi:tRNA pseudouridine55 synthase
MSVDKIEHDFPVFNLGNLPTPGLPFADGAVFILNKPLGWSSFRVVGLLRKLISIKKVGHAGTLDPMATGVLILCTGKATKIIDQYQGSPKSYRANITFGATTSSLDKETPIVDEKPFEHITEVMIRSVLESKFTGEIMQIPPMYSAIKHKGRPLYKMARVGKTIEREARAVMIHGSRVIEYKSPIAVIDIHCSKGTYIRTMAYDIGLELDTIAYLTGLERTAIGDISVDMAINIKTLINSLDPDDKAGIHI